MQSLLLKIEHYADLSDPHEIYTRLVETFSTIAKLKNDKELLPAAIILFNLKNMIIMRTDNIVDYINDRDNGVDTLNNLLKNSPYYDYFVFEDIDCNLNLPFYNVVEILDKSPYKKLVSPEDTKKFDKKDHLLKVVHEELEGFWV